MQIFQSPCMMNSHSSVYQGVMNRFPTREATVLFCLLNDVNLTTYSWNKTTFYFLAKVKSEWIFLFQLS